MAAAGLRAGDDEVRDLLTTGDRSNDWTYDPVVRLMNAARLAPGVAIVAYAAATFAALWMTAHAYARDPFPDETAAVAAVFGFVVFVLPLLTGFAIGRWWAPALVLWLLLAASVADGLEPLQREPTGEVEGTVELAAFIVAGVHVGLLLAGAGLRRLIRPRPPGKRWTLI